MPKFSYLFFSTFVLFREQKVTFDKIWNVMPVWLFIQCYLCQAPRNEQNQCNGYKLTWMKRSFSRFEHWMRVWDLKAKGTDDVIKFQYFKLSRHQRFFLIFSVNKQLVQHVYYKAKTPFINITWCASHFVSIVNTHWCRRHTKFLQSAWVKYLGQNF